MVGEFTYCMFICSEFWRSLACLLDGDLYEEN